MSRAARGARFVSIAATACGAAAVGAACFPTYDFSALEPGGPALDAATDATTADVATDANGGRDGSGGDDGPTGTDGGADGGADAPAADVVIPPYDAATMIAIEAGSFPFGGATGPTATLTHAFYIDGVEATVGRFKAFVSAGYPKPCDGGTCSLDPGGPYAAQMQWSPTWNAKVADTTFMSQSGCAVARDTGVQDPTYDDGVDTYPIGCVTWVEAVAMCAFEGKRLPTETEWEYVASGRGLNRKYPWGDTDPVACDQAIWFGGGPDDAGTKNGCHWPKPVGSAVNGGSRDGVLDLSGSVYEWVWDEATPAGGVDPISPSHPAATTREDRGGSFGSDLSYLAATTTDSTPYDGNFTDIGFRCARTLP